jgi:transposase
MIAFPAGVKIWIAGGVTDMRCGMNSLALKVHQGLGRGSHGGEIFSFRGRRGDLIKVLWHSVYRPSEDLLMLRRRRLR